MGAGLAGCVYVSASPASILLSYIVQRCLRTHMAQSKRKQEPGSPVATPRHDGWTAAKQVEFLRMLAATQNVGAAAQSVGMGRQSAYKLRARLDDQPFGAAWRLAVRDARNVVLDAAIERAVNGVEVPHFWKGELIGTSRRFDERLTTALLKTGANSNLKSASFDEKKKVYAQSSYELTNQIATLDDWTTSTIVDRQKVLADLAVRTWTTS